MNKSAHRRHARCGILLCLALLLAPLPLRATGAVVEAVVDHLHQALLYNMQHAGDESCSVRTERLGIVLEQVYDAPALARQVLRRHWGELSEDQRQRFEGAQRRLMESTYTANQSGYRCELDAHNRQDC